MNNKTLWTIAICAISTQAFADKEYWVGSDGDYVHDRNGHCVRTIKWTPEAAIPGCEGVVEKAEAPKAPAEKKPAAKPATVAAMPPKAEFSLSSGASFELGGATLSADGKEEIAALVKQFEGKTVDAVVIEGYTDSSGDAAFNQQLSEKRAEAVKAELVAHGAKAEKIKTVGYGEANPIADNSTREGRAKNRRVEIKVDGIKDKQP
jgi:OmpA-OmpF porin, OOP family